MASEEEIIEEEFVSNEFEYIEDEETFIEETVVTADLMGGSQEIPVDGEAVDDEESYYDEVVMISDRVKSTAEAPATTSFQEQEEDQDGEVVTTERLEVEASDSDDSREVEVLEETIEPPPQHATDESNSWMGPDDEEEYGTSQFGITPKRTNRRNEQDFSMKGMMNNIQANPIELSPIKGKAPAMLSDNTLHSGNVENRVESKSESLEKVWTRSLDDSNSATNSWTGEPTSGPIEITDDAENSLHSDDSIARAQKQVQFEGLPDNPPELTVLSSDFAPRVEENNDNDSDFSYETDSDSSYETDSEDLPIAARGAAEGPDRSSFDLERQISTQSLEEAKPKDSKLCIAQILCFASLILVGVAVCLYFFYEFAKDENRPAVQVALPPSVAPTFFMPSFSPAPTSSIPFNDACETAIGPLEPGTDTRGSTASASLDDVDRCEGSSADNFPGVWYYVIGTGGEMMAHTCNNTEIDSQISIFAGPCSNPECLEVSDNYCGRQSAVSWDSEFLTPYFILVQGRNLQRSIGSFELSIEARYNDECRNAINLKTAPRTNSPIIAGQTLEASPNPIVCGGETNASPSVWYRVGGTGGDIAAVLREGTDFNAKISILVGACSSFTCLSQSENGVRQVSWSSVEGEDYYIVVHGEGADDVGNFALQLRSGDASEQQRAPW